MKIRHTLVSLLVFTLAFSAVGPAFAAAPTSTTITLDDLMQYGTEMTLEELEQAEGEAIPLVAVGAITGAVGGAFKYATSPGEKSLTGLGTYVIAGAAAGVLTGFAATAAAVAAGGATVMQAGPAIISVIGGATVGALEGAVETIIHEVTK